MIDVAYRSERHRSLISEGESQWVWPRHTTYPQLRTTYRTATFDEPKPRHRYGRQMAGLAAARVLSDHYREVVLVERDELEEVPGHRRGVPQGRHTHGLLGSGPTIWEAFFPGLFEDLLRLEVASVQCQLQEADGRLSPRFGNEPAHRSVGADVCSSAPARTG